MLRTLIFTTLVASLVTSHLLYASDFSIGTPSQHCVVFCAKPDKKVVNETEASVGHAYVVLGNVTGKEKDKICSPAASWGFYPSENAGVFDKVPGELVDEGVQKSLPKDQCRLTVFVDKVKFDKVMKVVDEWKGKCKKRGKDYQLLFNNCIDFQSDISKSLDLKTPTNFGKFPQQYLQKLIEANVSTPNT